VFQEFKISCHNSIIRGASAQSSDGHPWRNWQVTLVAMEDGKEVKGKSSLILDHVEYILHPTFDNPRRSKQ
jgi:transcription initiation factor IIF auxiliary subunit